MRGLARSIATWLLSLGGLGACHGGCSAPSDAGTSTARSSSPREDPGRADRDAPSRPRARPGPASDEPEDLAKLVYLVSRDDSLWSFNPKNEGLAAYRRVGRLQCKAWGEPQSMSVDRHGSAWVFYGSGQLFQVSLEDASCRSTTYVHPSRNTMLGMGFTSVAPGSNDERLYVVSPDFGLATIDTRSLAVSMTGKLAGIAELTGGGDGRLFYFESGNGRLSEIDPKSGSLHLVHHFERLGYVASFAFARWAGRFYVFTAPGSGTSRVTEYDPVTDKERVRDVSIGFAVVGAGQSTLVPRSDGPAEVKEEFPP
jgi:hypothetical protein